MSQLVNICSVPKDVMFRQVNDNLKLLKRHNFNLVLALRLPKSRVNILLGSPPKYLSSIVYQWGRGDVRVIGVLQY